MTDARHVRSAAAPAPSLRRARAAGRAGRWSSSSPIVWLLVFFLIPFLIVFKISLSQTAIAMPPYTPVFGLDEGSPASGRQLEQLELRQLPAG